ncbi:MAG: M48 family metalloprotease [Mycobacteriales bacterium]
MNAASPSLIRSRPSDARRWFDPEEIRRAHEYQHPLRRVNWATNTAILAVMLVLLASHAVARSVHALGLGWELGLLLGVGELGIALALLNLPGSAWRQLAWDRQWGLSTQTTKSWVADQVKVLAVGLVIGAAVAEPVYAVIRATRWWWLITTTILAGFSVAALVLVPVVILPMFNRFTPLADGELRTRLERVAGLAGVRIRGSFTMDASRRTRRDNAFVAGLGPTKRVVVFDTLLSHPAHVVEHVVAHEIGHYRRHHIRLAIPELVVELAVTFAALQAICTTPALLRLAGASAVGSPASLPLLVVVLVGLQVLLAPVAAGLSRWRERAADLEALELLQDPGAMIDVWRRMAPKNLADLAPGLWRRLTASHPAMAERMDFAAAWAELNELPITPPPDGESVIASSEVGGGRDPADRP